MASQVCLCLTWVVTKLFSALCPERRDFLQENGEGERAYSLLYYPTTGRKLHFAPHWLFRSREPCRHVRERSRAPTQHPSSKRHSLPSSTFAPLFSLINRFSQYFFSSDVLSSQYTFLDADASAHSARIPDKAKRRESQRDLMLSQLRRPG